MELACLETGVAEHSLVLGKGVSIAAGRSAEHHQAELRGHWRRDAVFVGNEFVGNCSSSGCKRGMDLPQQAFTGGDVEVMQEIGKQRQVVAAAVFYVERASGDRAVAPGDSCGLCVFPCHVE